MIDSYCNINDTFSNVNSLDHMARQVNNNKKKNKTDIYNQFRKASDQTHRSIEAFNNLQLLQNDKDTTINLNNKDGGFYSAQGEYAPYVPKNKLGTLIKTPSSNPSPGSNSGPSYGASYSHIDKNNDESNDNYNNDASLSIEIDTPSCDSNYSLSTISIDSTISTEEIDKHIKTKSKFDKKSKINKIKRHHCIDFDIDSVDSLESLDSGESLLKHIKSCKKCKEKVIDLINKHKNSMCIDNVKMNQYKIQHNPESEIGSKLGSKKDSSEGFLTMMWSPEIKEIVTICLFGFLIIIMLDLLMRSLPYGTGTRN